MSASAWPIVGRKMSPRGSLGFGSSANLRLYPCEIEYSQRKLSASRNHFIASCGFLPAFVSVPSRPPQKTYVDAPSSTPRSMERIVFCRAYWRTRASLLVNAPSRKTGSPNRFVVAMGTQTPESLSAFLNSRTILSHSDADASRGTRSLSWRFTPYAPSSPSLRTMSFGEMGGRTGSPNGSRPGLPTVQRPKVKWCSGFGVNIELSGVCHPEFLGRQFAAPFASSAVQRSSKAKPQRAQRTQRTPERLRAMNHKLAAEKIGTALSFPLRSSAPSAVSLLSSSETSVVNLFLLTVEDDKLVNLLTARLVAIRRTAQRTIEGQIVCRLLELRRNRLTRERLKIREGGVSPPHCF